MARRIILSEQGLHCLSGGEGETLQAAGFAYVWEKVARQPGIDALKGAFFGDVAAIFQGLPPHLLLRRRKT